MVRSALIAGVIAVVVAVPARAQSQSQSKKFEIGVTGGWTFSEGLTSEQPVTLPAGTFTGINLDSGPSIGLSFNFLQPSGGELGFQWGRQWSTLALRGFPTLELGDLNIDQYHAVFGYNFSPLAKVRPFMSIGMGATRYNSVAYSVPNQSGEIDSATKFSFKLAMGIKTWGNDAVGFKAAMTWVPTAIRSKDTGSFCDPFVGCVLLTESTFSNQFELAGGVVFRFGGD